MAEATPRPMRTSGTPSTKRRTIRHGFAGSAAGEQVALPDGSTVVVRPVQPADQALLADGFGRLGVRSRRQRFLTVKRELTSAELRS